MTNTNLQHYSGDAHLSYFSQLFFCPRNIFLSASIGFCALAAIIRGLRGDKHMGNFFVDMWRVVVYVFLPAACSWACIFLQQGSPMTFESAAQVATLEPGAMGTTDDGEAEAADDRARAGGGDRADQAARHQRRRLLRHEQRAPVREPDGADQLPLLRRIILFPFALVVMFGRMLGRLRHAGVIFGVMMVMLVGMIVWAVYYDTLQPNPGLTGPAGRASRTRSPTRARRAATRRWTLPAVAGLPVDQYLGNLEGKELRFGTSAGATWAALTTTSTTARSTACTTASIRWPA